MHSVRSSSWLVMLLATNLLESYRSEGVKWTEESTGQHEKTLFAVRSTFHVCSNAVRILIYV